MTGFNKGLEKVKVALKWDQSPMGEPEHDLDLVAATYTTLDPQGEPDYLVHFDSRSPDGTINMDRDSRTGQGFGPDEVMTLELERLADSYVRVVVGVAIQQQSGRRVFGEVANTQVEIHEGYDKLAEDDFAHVPGATAATVAEFTRGDDGAWQLDAAVTGFDTDPETFPREMGRGPR